VTLRPISGVYKAPKQINTLGPVPVEEEAAARAISLHWEQLGAGSGLLGDVTGMVLRCPDGHGYYQTFESGSIYFTPTTGAHEVHGANRDLWASLGWENGFLGFPTTDETVTPDKIGRYNHFQGGAIYWTPQTGAHEIHGVILELWSSLGWERSSLGYPISDETGSTDADGSGRFSTFQNGAIFWTPTSGAHEIQGVILSELDYDWASITFAEGTAAGGTCHLTLTPDGGCHFTGHMHDSGSLAYNYSVAGVVEDVDDNAYTFGHTGNIAGTFESGSRDDPWDVNVTNPTIKENWLSLVAAAAAHGTPQALWKADVSPDLKGLTDSILSGIGVIAAVIGVIVGGGSTGTPVSPPQGTGT
jgi:uncharacterized protein with LGFP repeats